MTGVPERSLPRLYSAALMEFRKQMNERYPRLAVETGLMALDGGVEMLSS